MGVSEAQNLNKMLQLQQQSDYSNLEIEQINARHILSPSELKESQAIIQQVK
jgi:hypothetical protein